MATTIKGQRFKTYTYAAASALTPSLGEQMAITAITGIQESPFMIVGDGVKTVAQLIAIITSNDTKVITANYTVESWVKRIVVNTTAAITITIPTTRPTNDEIEIERSLTSAEAVTLARSGTETIAGQTAYLIYGTKKVTIAKATSTTWIRTDYEMKPLLSDLSRVMALNGDGIPMFPDNVAGRTYLKDKDWTVTDSWTGGTGVTVSVESSKLKVVPTTAGISNISKASAAYQNKLIRIIITSSIPLTNITTFTGSSVATPMRVTSLGGNKYVADVYWARTGSDSFAIWPDYALSTLPTWYLESIYIGSGLYDTPVYDKACCNRMINNGVLPVQGTRGLAMSFNGAQYLQADNPVIGITGTNPVYWKRGRIGVAETLFSNQSATTNGIRYYIDASNDLYALFGGASPVSVLIKTGFTDITAYHSFGVIVSGTTATPFYDFALGTSVSVTPVSGLANLTIGRNPLTSSDYATGSGYISIYANQWTLKEVNRYYDGDDAVDSQQKAQNNVPYAIKVCDSKGNIRQPGLPVYADNTAALAGGLVAGEPYRTSTGILMVVY